MKKTDLLSTLFVGIDISSRSNVVALLDFESQKPLRTFLVANNQPGAMEMAQYLLDFLGSRPDLEKLVVALESTSFYGVHIANFLSSHEMLTSFHIAVYCLNPKTVANYKKSFIDLGKNDFVDAFVLADFARVGRITNKPWRGSQFLALQRLTRPRLHLAKSLSADDTPMSKAGNAYLRYYLPT